MKTGEEDEEVMFKGKCKAYRFDEGENEWKERAVGEMRLLKNKEGRVCRLVWFGTGSNRFRACS